MFHCDFFLHSNFLPSYSVSQQFHNSRCFLVHLPWLLSLLVSHQVSKTRIKHWLQLHFVIQKNEMKIKWAPWTELSSWHSLKLIFLLAMWFFFSRADQWVCSYQNWQAQRLPAPHPSARNGGCRPACLFGRARRDTDTQTGGGRWASRDWGRSRWGAEWGSNTGVRRWEHENINKRREPLKNITNNRITSCKVKFHSNTMWAAAKDRC